MRGTQPPQTDESAASADGGSVQVIVETCTNRPETRRIRGGLVHVIIETCNNRPMAGARDGTDLETQPAWRAAVR